MEKKLAKLEKRFEELNQLIIDPKVISDIAKYTKITQEYKSLETIVNKNKLYKQIEEDISSHKQMLYKEKDDDFKNLIKEELEDLIIKKEEVLKSLKQLLIPKDPNDEKNAILEIRAGTGGEEAAVFVGDLFRMYTKFAEIKSWKMTIVETHAGVSGGYKEIIANIIGNNVYSIMKYESGVHRVQRVPITEKQGRVHTSAATVAVLPEIDPVSVNINPNDIRKDTFCSSGAGGQSVNTTYSAVRVTHIPTGLVVTCQDERSQLKNMDKALKVLYARLYKLEQEKQHESISSERKSIVKSGDRSDKIRTYNYPENRLTDHRINYTVHQLGTILEGELDQLIEALKVVDESQQNKGRTIQ